MLVESVYCFFGYSALMKLKDQNLFLNAEMFSLLYYLHTWVMSNAALVSVIWYFVLHVGLLSTYHLTPKLTSCAQNGCVLYA